MRSGRGASCQAVRAFHLVTGVVWFTLGFRSCQHGRVCKTMMHNRCFPGLKTVFGVLRGLASFVLVAAPPNLLSGRRPGAVNLSNEEARDCGAAKVHHPQLIEFMVLDGDVGGFGFPEYLYHALIIPKPCRSGGDISHISSATPGPDISDFKFEGGIPGTPVDRAAIVEIR